MGVLRNEIKSNFTQVPNKLLFDSRLSFGARILFCYLASKPNDWKIINQEIINTLHCSCDSIAKYFKELLTVGWISRERETDEKGQFCGGYNYTVYSTPVKPEKSITGKTPNMGKDLIGKNGRNINNINLSSNNIPFSNNIKANNIINNNINNNKPFSDNIKFNNNKQEYVIKLDNNDRMIYTSFKEILDEDKDKTIEKGTEISKEDINIPKTENNAKKVPKQNPNPKKKFIKPTIEQVKQYALEANLTKLDPYTFYDHFESNGWKVSGISPMKDWKAAMRNWNRRSDKFNNTQQSNKNKNIFLEEYKRLEEEERNNKGE